jgi:hypothetical protein
MGSKRGCITNRIIISALLLIGSLGISVILWSVGYPFFFMFLFIPLIPFFGKKEINHCPICGFKGYSNEKYCPYDGIKLEKRY